MVVTGAVLNHKTKLKSQSGKRRYDWKDYYDIRNRILMVREHGTMMDRVVNSLHLFIHVIFRNRLFQAIRRERYDWKYENDIVKRAIRDANDRNFKVGETYGIAEDIVSKRSGM